MIDEGFVWLRIRRRIAYLIASLLRVASVEPHYQASKSKDPDETAKLRQQGDDIHQVAKDIERALNPPEDPQ